MMMNYQGAGGMPYVASVHSLVAKCFYSYGNKHHGTEVAVSLTDFCDAIKERHSIGDDGIMEEKATGIDDYT